MIRLSAQEARAALVTFDAGLAPHPGVWLLA